MAKAPRGIAMLPKNNREAARVLSPDALQFVADLHRASRQMRDAMKSQRAERQQMFDKGGLPDFRPDTLSIRSGTWKAAPPPRDLTDLRCGIVTAGTRRDLLTALNSGAKLCLADLADFTSPGWDNLTASHINLMDRWTSAMEHVDKASGRRMSLSQRLAALMVQPRSLMADEPRVKCDGKPVSAGLFDAGLYLFHNARVALAKASGPYLQLPDVASQAEARLWNDILLHAQSLLGLPAGSVRVHVRIDTLSAAFEMDEIIHDLREHICGISPGGLSYGFDVIRSFAAQKSWLADDEGVADGALKDLVIRTAHRRGLLALGPRARAHAQVAAEQAVRSGFDGVWTSHPEHATASLKVFNDDMPTPNQTYVSRDDVRAGQAELLRRGGNTRSEIAVRQDIAAALAALESWLSGEGQVEVDGMIEDRASADFHRAHLWQGLRHGVKLDGAKKFTAALFEQYLGESLSAMKSRDGRFKDAASLLKALVTAPELEADLFARTWKKFT